MAAAAAELKTLHDAMAKRQARWQAGIPDPSVPSELHCPIIRELFTDPVVAADGFTYERSAIEHWLREHDSSPNTNVRLAHKELVPNVSLRILAKEYEVNVAGQLTELAITKDIARQKSSSRHADEVRSYEERIE
eukprot:5325641-Prymnesium_polylepis.1